VVAQEREVILPNLRPVVETAPPPLVIRGFGNGIDLVINSPIGPQRYEEDCFLALVKNNPQFFVIGPHFIDYAFVATGLTGEVRPDALLLSRGRDNQLVGMSEFKSSKTNGIHKKTEGFSRLLALFRKDQALLPDILNNTLEDAGIYEKPFSRIIIPPDSEIDVTFISPHKVELVREMVMPFNARHILLPKSRLASVH